MRCGVPDNALIQRSASDGTTWRKVDRPVFGDHDWFSFEIASVFSDGICNAYMCRKSRAHQVVSSS